MVRLQTAVGLCVSAAVGWSLSRIHSMGRPRQPCIQGRRPQWTGTSLGKPQGEHPVSVWLILQRKHAHSWRDKTGNHGPWKESKCWNVQSPFTEPRQYDLWENVPSFAALLQAEHHQKGTRTKTSLQVSVLFCLSFPSCLFPTAANNTAAFMHPI